LDPQTVYFDSQVTNLKWTSIGSPEKHEKIYILKLGCFRNTYLQVQTTQINKIF